MRGTHEGRVGYGIRATNGEKGRKNVRAMKLSIQDINAKAPYKVSPTGHDAFVVFATEYDVQYLVGFEYDDTSLAFEAYQLVIINTNNKKSPRDMKVKGTIVAIVESFFQDNKNVLLYICETGDRKQMMRSRLFEYWFSSYMNKDMFVMVSGTVKDDEGIVNHTAIIVRTDNPLMPQIVADFSKTISLLNNKPNL